MFYISSWRTCWRFLAFCLLHNLAVELMKKKNRNFAVESFKEISACQRLGPFWFMFCLKLRSRPPKLRNHRTCLGTCPNWTLQVLVLIKVTHWFSWKCGIVLEKNLFTEALYSAQSCQSKSVLDKPDFKSEAIYRWKLQKWTTSKHENCRINHDGHGNLSPLLIFRFRILIVLQLHNKNLGAKISCLGFCWRPQEMKHGWVYICARHWSSNQEA